MSDCQQEVVPDELLESYLSMTEQIKAQVVDTDLPYYCAYSLPGVALTLGQEHWPLLKPTFSMLASDMQVPTLCCYSLLSWCVHSWLDEIMVHWLHSNAWPSQSYILMQVHEALCVPSLSLLHKQHYTTLAAITSFPHPPTPYSGVFDECCLSLSTSWPRLWGRRGCVPTSCLCLKSTVPRTLMMSR